MIQGGLKGNWASHSFGPIQLEKDKAAYPILAIVIVQNYPAFPGSKPPN